MVTDVKKIGHPGDHKEVVRNSSELHIIMFWHLKISEFLLN